MTKIFINGDYIHKMNRLEGYFRGKNDVELFYQLWKNQNSIATIVVTHGLGEHSECYKRLVDGVQDSGCDILIWDLRGHGRSEGKRGVIGDFSDFSQDLVCFLDHIYKNISRNPFFFLSHSMGGLIVLNTLLDNPQISPLGAIFSSPLLGVAVEVPEIKRKGAKFLSEYFPSFTLWNEIKHNVLTHEKKIIEEFDRDPLRHDRISAKLFLDFQSYFNKVLPQGKRIELPIFFQIAAQDKVVSSRVSIDFFDTLGSKDKKLKLYENSYHEIYNDIEREYAFRDVREWILQHRG